MTIEQYKELFRIHEHGRLLRSKSGRKRVHRYRYRQGLKSIRHTRMLAHADRARRLG